MKTLLLAELNYVYGGMCRCYCRIPETKEVFSFDTPRTLYTKYFANVGECRNDCIVRAWDYVRCDYVAPHPAPDLSCTLL